MWGQRREGVFLWIMGGRTHLFGIFRKLHRNLCSLGSFGRIFHNRNTAKINPEGVTIRRLCGSLFRVPEAPAVAENSEQFACYSARDEHHEGLKIDLKALRHQSGSGNEQGTGSGENQHG